MPTTGEALIRLLEAHGVDTVFGIPGVHTIELYRGLAGSGIRHVTPRHEQGAAFMADGYARVSGRPGVALLITGPGVTNAITAMAQARGDSVPMLVISGTNPESAQGRGFGLLHELPDQLATMRSIALSAQRVRSAGELPGALAQAFSLFASRRPGPVHIEIPTDVMKQPAEGLHAQLITAVPPAPRREAIARATELLARARRPLVLAGGGARRSEAGLRSLAERLNAPVVLTTNARGLLYQHPLAVPAAPSLACVRALVADADVTVAVGTEIGQTDYDMYDDGAFVAPATLVRIDIDPAQIARQDCAVAIEADCGAALEALLASDWRGSADGGEARAATVRRRAWEELNKDLQAQVRAVEAIRDTLPGAIIVGDSTQPVYAANLCYAHDQPGRWFNAATGYGALGYGAPAAIGAALAMPQAPVVCLTGDGGLQFSLAELGSAVEAEAPVIFVVWNNRGYREIEVSMKAAGVVPVGVSPPPPDFCAVAAAYGMGAERVDDLDGLTTALIGARDSHRPRLIELLL